MEVGSRKSEVGSRKSEVGSRKSEVGSRKSEVGSRKSEVGSRKSEVGSRKSEVGSRKSEVGSRKSEVGSRKSLLGFRRLQLLLNSRFSLLTTVSCVSIQTVRSASRGLSLVVPAHQTQAYGARSFSVAAPTLWNSLPVDIKNAHAIFVYF